MQFFVCIEKYTNQHFCFKYVMENFFFCHIFYRQRCTNFKQLWNANKPKTCKVRARKLKHSSTSKTYKVCAEVMAL